MNVIIVFLQKAITQGIPLLFGANGEILTEKSGNLNLGVPGMMYMGGICGLIQEQDLNSVCFADGCCPAGAFVPDGEIGDTSGLQRQKKAGSIFCAFSF